MNPSSMSVSRGKLRVQYIETPRERLEGLLPGRGLIVVKRAGVMVESRGFALAGVGA